MNAAITAATPPTISSQRAHERLIVKVPGILRVPDFRSGTYLITVLDASKVGLQISSPIAIPSGTSVEVRVLGTAIRGTARYTREMDRDFNVGIEAYAIDHKVNGATSGEFDLTLLLDRGKPTPRK